MTPEKLSKEMKLKWGIKSQESRDVEKVFR